MNGCRLLQWRPGARIACSVLGWDSHHGECCSVCCAGGSGPLCTRPMCTCPQMRVFWMHCYACTPALGAGLAQGARAISHCGALFRNTFTVTPDNRPQSNLAAQQQLPKPPSSPALCNHNGHTRVTCLHLLALPPSWLPGPSEDLPWKRSPRLAGIPGGDYFLKSPGTVVLAQTARACACAHSSHGSCDSVTVEICMSQTPLGTTVQCDASRGAVQQLEWAANVYGAQAVRVQQGLPKAWPTWI